MPACGFAKELQMVIAHHLIWTLYGWWLPNDPRGSMSHTIASDVIADLGKLHYGRRRVQPASRDIRKFYARAAEVLKFPLLLLNPIEFESVAASFRKVIQHRPYTCYACALMPDHIHMVIRKHKDLAEGMIANFQAASRETLNATEKWREHPIWGGPGWKVFLDAPDDVGRTIPYVENNPIKLRLPAQKWDFVEPYNNWPFHKRPR
jgi:REP element-mobilizing transposase RayT